jgi:hypothetical protein
MGSDVRLGERAVPGASLATHGRACAALPPGARVERAQARRHVRRRPGVRDLGHRLLQRAPASAGEAAALLNRPAGQLAARFEPRPERSPTRSPQRAAAKWGAPDAPWRCVVLPAPRPLPERIQAGGLQGLPPGRQRKVRCVGWEPRHLPRLSHKTRLPQMPPAANQQGLLLSLRPCSGTDFLAAPQAS